MLLNNMSTGFNYINNFLLEQFQKWTCKIFQNADILISPGPLSLVGSYLHLADPPPSLDGDILYGWPLFAVEKMPLCLLGSLELTYIIFLCYRVMTAEYVITGNFNFNGYNKNCHSYCLDWANFSEYWHKGFTKNKIIH